jgi:hypothetical protein
MSCKHETIKKGDKNYTLTLCPNHTDTGEKNEMDGACGMYGGGERCAQGVGGEI